MRGTWRGMTRALRLAAAAATLAALAGPAAAQAEGDDTAAKADAGMRVQLNKMTPVDEACRIYLVFENRTGAAFDAYTLDLVMFDKDGAILQRLAVEAGRLPAGKTLVKPFDMPDTECGRIGKLLLNEVMTCTGPGAGDGERDCTTRTTTASRLEIPFIK